MHPDISLFPALLCAIGQASAPFVFGLAALVLASAWSRGLSGLASLRAELSAIEE
jgi:hypothetical protein